MAKLYVSGDQNMALVEQAGPMVSITYSNPSGGVYGSSALVWVSEKKAFIGSGTINTVCGVYDKRIWPAPRQVEIHLFNASIIRHRTLNPVRVNCARSRVIESAWSELVWHVPTK
jgi:hypothetical protein